MEKNWLKNYDPTVRQSLPYDEGKTMLSFLEEAAKEYPQQICLIGETNEYTFQETLEKVMRVAQNLVRMGIKKGQKIGLSLPNCPEFVIAYYGILRAGAVVVAINPYYKEREYTYQIKDAGIDWLICSVEKVDAYQSLLKEGLIERIVCVKNEREVSDEFEKPGYTISDGQSERVLSFDQLMKLSKQVPELPDVEPDDVAILQYSGGTTGEPKGAVGLHRNLAANTLQFTEWLSICKAGEEVVLTAIPLYHVYGMIVAMSVGIALGGSLVLIKNPRDINGILEKIQRYQATLFPGVPNMYSAINQNPSMKQGIYNLKSIKVCISGSAPLSPETKRIFEKFISGTLVEGYGLSEAPTATHCNPVSGDNRAGSIGLPLPDVDCKIVDLEHPSIEKPIGETGELLIKGPQVMQGYHQRPEETVDALKDGWLHTGDIADVDQDGYFYLVARKKELIKIGGFQVWPREIEEVLAENPNIQEAAVAGVPGSNLTERVKAWIVLKPDVQMTEQKVRSWCRDSLAGYKVPALVEFVSELPRTAVGKVLKRELIRRHIELTQD